MLDSVPHLSQPYPTHVKTCLNHSWSSTLHTDMCIFKTSLKINHHFPLLKLAIFLKSWRFQQTGVQFLSCPSSNTSSCSNRRSGTELPSRFVHRSTPLPLAVTSSATASGKGVHLRDSLMQLLFIDAAGNAKFL